MDSTLKPSRWRPRKRQRALVDYMKDPTSYDGEYNISELHPSMRDAELYPAMRDLTDEDLRLMAGSSWWHRKFRATSGAAKIYFDLNQAIDPCCPLMVVHPSEGHSISGRNCLPPSSDGGCTTPAAHG